MNDLVGVRDATWQIVTQTRRYPAGQLARRRRPTDRQGPTHGGSASAARRGQPSTGSSPDRNSKRTGARANGTAVRGAKSRCGARIFCVDAELRVRCFARSVTRRGDTRR
jgi:hypothetical protein